jgi:uncharacterized protein YhaN
VNSAFVKARVAGELQGLAVREGDTVQGRPGDRAHRPVRGRRACARRSEQADAAKAQIDIAERQYDNNKALVDQGFISRTALDTSLNNLNAAPGHHQAALAAVDMARKGWTTPCCARRSAAWWRSAWRSPASAWPSTPR